MPQFLAAPGVEPGVRPYYLAIRNCSWCCVLNGVIIFAFLSIIFITVSFYLAQVSDWAFLLSSFYPPIAGGFRVPGPRLSTSIAIYQQGQDFSGTYDGARIASSSLVNSQINGVRECFHVDTFGQGIA